MPVYLQFKNMSNIYEDLQKYFDYSSFLPYQEEIIRDVVSKRYVLAGSRSKKYSAGILTDASPMVQKPVIQQLNGKTVSSSSSKWDISVPPTQNIRLSV